MATDLSARPRGRVYLTTPRAAIPSKGTAVDLAKHDMTVTFAGRTFSLRAYLDGNHPDGPGWYAVVVENRTPLPYEESPATNPADCLAEAVRFVVAFAEASAAVASARR